VKNKILSILFLSLMWIESKCVSKLSADDMEYDPSDLSTFDPTGSIVREKDNEHRGNYLASADNTRATLSIRVKSGSSQKQTVELFSALNNLAFIKNDSVISAGTPVGPVTPFSLLKVIGRLASIVDTPANEIVDGANAAAVQTYNNAIFNDNNGNLLYTLGSFMDLGHWGLAYPNVPMSSATDGVFMEISCQQVPYRRLLEDCKDMVLKVNLTRIAYSTTQGKYNDLRFKKYKSFAQEDNNAISPLSYFSPNQFQPMEVDIPEVYYIDKMTGLYLDIEPMDDVTLNFFIVAYRNNGLAFDGVYGAK